MNKMQTGRHEKSHKGSSLAGIKKLAELKTE
jgi:hypothetical protein